MLSNNLDTAIDSKLYDWEGFNRDVTQLLEAEFVRRQAGKPKRNINQLTGIVRKLLESRKSDDFKIVSNYIAKEQERLYSAFVRPLAAHYGDRATTITPIDVQNMEKAANKQCAKLARKIYYTANRMERDYEKELERL